MLSVIARAGPIVLSVCVIAGCAFMGSRALRTDPTRQGSCSVGVGRDATIHGSASDTSLAWAIDNTSGNRVELIWPVGYTAQFGPQLVVLDRDGKAVAHDGDLIIGSCLTRPEDGDAIAVDPAEIRLRGWQPGDG